MRLAVGVLAALCVTACAVLNPSYGADTDSAGDGDGDGSGDGESSVDGTTAMSTGGAGTVTGESTQSATGTGTATAETATTDESAGDETDAGSSSTGPNPPGPVQPPCIDTPPGFEVVGCWDFDALNAAGDAVLNRVVDGPPIDFASPIEVRPGLWGQALGLEDSPSGSAEIAPVGDVLIEVWFRTENPVGWPPEGTLLRLWNDWEQTNEFASLRLLGPPEAQRRFDAGLMFSELATGSAVTDCAAFEVVGGQMDIHTGLSSGTFFATVGNVGAEGFAFTVGEGAAAIVDGIRISSAWSPGGICSPPPP